MLAHIENTDEVIKTIDRLREDTSDSKVQVILSTYKSEIIQLSEFKQVRCREYFIMYFKKLAYEGPIVLPNAAPSEIEKVVETMNGWCKNTNETSGLKGIVVHSFDMLKYIKWFYDKEISDGRLDIKDFPSTSVNIVYNPKENVILLIQKSTEQDEATEGKRFHFNMLVLLKMFLLLFFDELENSGVKVIPLLVSSKNITCHDCRNFIVSDEELQSCDFLDSWWYGKSTKFGINNTEIINESKVEAFSAKFVSFLAAAQYFDEIPTFTKDPNEKMENALVILTPEQKNILYSRDCNHLIVKGPYGSGKSIIAMKKLQMLSKSVPEDEVVCFICYDSRSELWNEIEGSSKVKLCRNEEGNPLSVIIKQTLNETSDTKNINFIIDEFDGEDLDENEARQLNKLFTKESRNAVILLITQSMEKERITNDVLEAKNRFDLLETMKTEELSLVMRNSVEINNLVRVTEIYLEKESTIYRYPEIEQTTERIKKEKSGAKPKLATSVAASSEENAINGADKGMQANSSRHLENQKLPTFGMDEAFDLAGIPRGSNEDKNKIVNTFKYKASDNTGHYIHIEYPKLFEVSAGMNEFQKILALKVIIQKLNIANANANNKHVILHFLDTRTGDIPNLFKIVFQSLDKFRRVTSEYKEFRRNATEKAILVCNFRAFRGLESPAVTIVIDRDIYSRQHYLVEAMTRCTSKLAVVVLEKSNTLSRITDKWIARHKTEPLIDHWKLEMMKERKKGQFPGNFREKSNVISINPFSKNHKQLKVKFDNEEAQYKEENLGSMMVREAEEKIRNRCVVLKKIFVEKFDCCSFFDCCTFFRACIIKNRLCIIFFAD